MRNANLHTHTMFSLNDGTIMMEEYIKWCRENGNPPVITTDHGNLMAVEAFRSAVEADNKHEENADAPLKYIPGVEAYVDMGDGKKRHLVLLPVDYIGYKQIMTAVTESNKNIDSAGAPVMSYELLKALFGTGSTAFGHVYALSACITGVVATELLSDSKIEKKAMTEESKAERIAIEWDKYEETKVMLEKETEKLTRLTTERKRLGVLKDKPYKKRLKALDSLQITLVASGYEEAKEQLYAEIEETNRAIEEYPQIREAEKTTSRNCTKLRNAAQSYQKCIGKREEHLSNACTLRQTKVGFNAMYENAECVADTFNDLFGAGFFLLELQNHGMEDEALVYPLIATIAGKLNIPLVATNDAHMPTNSDSDRKKRQLLRSLRYNRWEEAQVGDEHLCLKTDEDLKEMLSLIIPQDIVDKAIEKKNEIAEKCNVVFPAESHYPKFPVKGMTAKEYLVKLTAQGVYARYPNLKGWTEEHKQRVRHELSIIEKLGVVDYLLIVQDFLEYGRLLGKIDLDNPEYLADPFNTVLLKRLGKGNAGMSIGCGRGSAVGSLVCYLIGITDADPIKYGLLFERFLNTERVTMPDIDSDFSPEIRGKVLDYVKFKYGESGVCCIMTIGTQAAKASVRNCTRVISDRKYNDGTALYSLGSAICSHIPDELGVTLNDTKKAEGCAKSLMQCFAGNAEALEIIEAAMLVEGTFVNVGMHAAGVIISDDKAVSEYIPLMKSKEGMWVTQYDMNYVEGCGLLKMDFLGLRNLSIITETLRLIQKTTGNVIEMNEVDLDDSVVFDEIFCKGQTDSVFQFESDGMKSMIRQFMPTSIEDLILLVAAYRPGPLESLQEIITNKLKGKNPSYLMPAMKEELGLTYGKIVYQEQLMAIFNKFAGFSLGESDIIRRYMSKKKVEKFMAYHDKFIDGLVANGAKQDAAEEFWNSIVSFSKYAFNKSHACAYAITAYYTAWLKCHYPREYITAVLNDTEFAKVGRIISDAKRFGIKVLPPDINKSEIGFSLAGDDSIRYGLSNIKQVASSADSITKERENGEYKSFEDFVQRTDVQKNVLLSLINAGCFDCFESEKLSSIEKRLAYFIQAEAEPPKSETECLIKEKVVLSAFISANPVEGYKAKNTIAEIEGGRGKKTIYSVIGMITEMVKRNTKDGKEMATFVLEDKTGEIKAVCFPDVFCNTSELIQENTIVRVVGYCKPKGDGTDSLQLIVNCVNVPHVNISVITLSAESYVPFLPIIEEYKTSADNGVCFVVNANSRFVDIKTKVRPEILTDDRINKYLSTS